MPFHQEDFEYHSLYGEDSCLKEVAGHCCAPEHFEAVDNDLTDFSEKVRGEILELMWRAESNEPRLKAYDHWGNRVDETQVGPARKALHGISAIMAMTLTLAQTMVGGKKRLSMFLLLLEFAAQTRKSRDQAMACVFIDELIFPHFPVEDSSFESFKETVLS